MRHARAEVTTHMADLTGYSLADLRDSEDPVLLRSVVLVTGHTECRRTGLLQNQVPDTQ